jgi:hypothetical protein
MRSHDPYLRSAFTGSGLKRTADMVPENLRELELRKLPQER